MKKPPVEFDGTHCPVCGSENVKKFEREITAREKETYKNLPQGVISILEKASKEIMFICDDCKQCKVYRYVNSQGENFLNTDLIIPQS